MSDWVAACRVDDVDQEDVIPLEIAGRHFAIYRSPDDQFYATDGFCTHEQFLLADGLVMGNIIECPKHNGRFDYRTGEGRGVPICVNLVTYPVRREAGTIWLDLGAERDQGNSTG
jgi:3-phenylpropionate/trans-cinnamate dioxygenase ferredoxin subunit